MWGGCEGKREMMDDDDDDDDDDNDATGICRATITIQSPIIQLL